MELRGVSWQTSRGHRAPPLCQWSRPCPGLWRDFTPHPGLRAPGCSAARASVCVTTCVRPEPCAAPLCTPRAPHRQKTARQPESRRRRAGQLRDGRRNPCSQPAASSCFLLWLPSPGRLVLLAASPVCCCPTARPPPEADAPRCCRSRRRCTCPGRAQDLRHRGAAPRARGSRRSWWPVALLGPRAGGVRGPPHSLAAGFCTAGP